MTLILDRVAITLSGRPLVHDVSLQLRPGEVVGLLGPNGAGKTTALNMLIGHHNPSSGTIMLENLDIRKDLDEIRL